MTYYTTIRPPSETPSPENLADLFEPTLSGLYERLEKRGGGNDLFDFKWHATETAFQIGVLAGVIFTGASDREIDRLERGLFHATVSRRERVKDK